MPTASRTLLWYLLAGTRGGPNRLRILEKLEANPYNANQLAGALDMDYRTVRHHLSLLERNGLIQRPVGRGYASPYELAPDTAARFEEVRSLRRSDGHRRRRVGSGSRSSPGRLGT